MNVSLMEDAKRMFEFHDETFGFYFDLRLTSTLVEEWLNWQDVLLGMASAVIIEMYRGKDENVQLHEVSISSDSERIENEMVFRFFSSIGKMEVLFSLNPKTLEIHYKDVFMCQYEETFALLV